MKKHTGLLTRGILAAVLGIAVGVLLVSYGNKGKADQVDGLYAMGMNQSDEITTTTFCLSFDAKEGTYQVLLGGDKDAIALETGSFSYADGMVTTKTGDGKESDSYAKEGEYLIATDFLYDGEVPQDEKFDAVCTYESSDGMVSTVTFSADGTYTEESGSGEDKTQDAGSYTREGDVIERTSSSGNAVANYYVYKGKITNSFYKYMHP
ncbi:MAG: hypothetical protein MRZ75_04055 [Roseburia sp.]|nr:hypothetical protein [Roseburia sp.]MDY5882057.1 hypothetical protein [Roseburia sp.]